jgi:hypothetical protein
VIRPVLLSSIFITVLCACTTTDSSFDFVPSTYWQEKLESFDLPNANCLDLARSFSGLLNCTIVCSDAAMKLTLSYHEPQPNTVKAIFDKFRGSIRNKKFKLHPYKDRTFVIAPEAKLNFKLDNSQYFEGLINDFEDISKPCRLGEFTIKEAKKYKLMNAAIEHHKKLNPDLRCGELKQRYDKLKSEINLEGTKSKKDALLIRIEKIYDCHKKDGEICIN